MSEISERVTARILMCDFVNIDNAGKANLIGAGVRILGLDSSTQSTSPFGLFVYLESPLSGDGPALEVLLTTAAGQVYKLPGPEGTSQALRISQNVDFNDPLVPGLSIPKGAVPPVVQFAVNFANGLPLRAGYSYQFRAQLDHEIVATYSFFIPRAPSGPVMG